VTRERPIWGWFEAAPVAIRDPDTSDVRPVRIETSEAETLGIPRRTMVVYDQGDCLEVLPADTAPGLELDPDDYCASFHPPGSADWVLIRRRDGARATIRRGASHE
jgi:hypothetical protein